MLHVESALISFHLHVLHQSEVGGYLNLFLDFEIFQGKVALFVNSCHYCYFELEYFKISINI